MVQTILRVGDIHPSQQHYGVYAFRAAWASCPANCIPLVLSNLNINFEHPRDTWEEQTTDLLDETNLVNTSQKFSLWRCKMQAAEK
jgi:hypothetical protein